MGEGFHERAGEPHAEAVALAQAGPRASGATAYVTLEPCNHFGKTPPCSEALITRGIAGVVIGMADPNPVAVGGSVRLREANVEVDFEQEPAPFQIQNESWLHWLRTGRPFVQVKAALSLDGKATLAQGRRTTITGTHARELTMRLRSAADAVLIGAETARVDDPSLLVRQSDGAPAETQPLRVILGRAGVPDASLFRDGAGRAIALLPAGTTAATEIETLAFDPPGGIGAALDVLGGLGVTHLLIEAGPRLLSALWEEHAIDELVFIHGGGMAGAEAPTLFSAASQGERDALERTMQASECGIVGRDAVTVWRPTDTAPSSAEKGE